MSFWSSSRINSLDTRARGPLEAPLLQLALASSTCIASSVQVPHHVARVVVRVLTYLQPSSFISHCNIQRCSSDPVIDSSMDFGPCNHLFHAMYLTSHALALLGLNLFFSSALLLEAMVLQLHHRLTRRVTDKCHSFWNAANGVAFYKKFLEKLW